MAKKKIAETEPVSFEESLTQLQWIVQNLEEGSLGLEEALQQYQQGTGLLRRCYEILNSAEQKIEQLTGFDASGNAVCEPFDASGTLEQREQTAGRRQQGTARNAAAEEKGTVPPAKSGPNLFTSAE